MSEHIVKLQDQQAARDGDVEVLVTSGVHKGDRYSVRPKDHVTCHRTGRTVRLSQGGRSGEPAVCDCVVRAVEREAGKGVAFEARWLTPEQKQEARRARLAAELVEAQTALAEQLTKRDLAVQQCADGAAAARTRADQAAQMEQGIRERLEQERDGLAAAKAAVAQAEEAVKSARHAAEHARLSVQASEQSLESWVRTRVGAQDTALKLEGEAERLRDRSEQAGRIEGLRRAVTKLEAEIEKGQADEAARRESDAPVESPGAAGAPEANPASAEAAV